MFPEHDILEQHNFKAIEPIGRGACGMVWKIQDLSSGEYHACKLIQKQKRVLMKPPQKCKAALGPKENINQEETIMQAIDNVPNCLRLRNVLQGKHFRFLICELQDGCLKEEVIPEGECRAILQSVLRAVMSLHEKKILHLDLKPQNILRNLDGRIVLGDFGQSLFVSSPSLQLRQDPNGTMGFTAPELYTKEAGEALDGGKLDAWAIGVTTFLLLEGRMPFPAGNHEELVQMTRDGLNFDGAESLEARDFIKGLLNNDPEQRLSVKQAFEHPFMKGESSSM